MSAFRLAAGLQGRLIERGSGRVYQDVSIDSRTCPPGALFIAIQAKRSGEAFFSDALAQGAGALAGRRFSRQVKAWAKKRGAALIQVRHGLTALHSLARDQRSFLRGPVVAITGSNGKTGAKALLAHLLAKRGPVLATRGNLNNHLGLPLTLLSARPGQWASVLELGMNHAGELAGLSKLCKPDVGVELMVGDAHHAYFKSRAEIAAAKRELLSAMPSSSLALVNADDAYTLAMGQNFGGRWKSFGLSSQADLRGSQVRDQGARGMTLILNWQGRKRLVRMQQGGVPSLRKALAAACAALVLGLELDEVAVGLASYREVLPGRLELLKRHGRTFIVDAYNASPQSMAAALDYLAKSAPAEKRYAALGEMRELGRLTRSAHTQLGHLARHAGVSRLLTLGQGAQSAARSFGKGSLALGLDQVALGAAWLGAVAPQGSWILLKGSRASRIERLLESWPLGL